ncbi:inositol monophosphatase [Patescibacteria group bacterium]|nr:inositol monophosphatase [Patescibacteria group bacterium]
MYGALVFAEQLAKEAGAIIRQNFSLGMRREWKSDNTPLTATDIAINHLVLEAVEKEYPTHSFIGEEGSNLKESEYAWVCDPVDGTIPFSHGYPTFAFSLALTKNGESIVGVMYDPIMDRLISAEKGKGAHLNGQKISVSSEKMITKQSFVELNTDDRMTSLRAYLHAKECYVPTFYSCVYPAMLVATGEFAAAIYPYDKPWDAAAVKIVVEEAGGKVTDLDGNDQRYDGKINGFVASNGYVHDEVIRALKS